MSTRIFLAEEDEDKFLMFHEALSLYLPSYEMHRVQDGFETIYALKRFEIPDYIFLNLDLPLKNGIDCLQTIRSIPELHEVPVIIYAPTHHIKYIDLAYKYGATYYLVIPSNFNSLALLLKKLFLKMKQPGFGHYQKSEFVVRDLHKTPVGPHRRAS